MTFALGIDVGTSGIRTAVIDENGSVVSTASTQHLEQNPESINAELWWDAVRTCLRVQIHLLKERLISPDAIASIGVDGTSGSMVLTDSKLQPVTRALMYNSGGFEEEAALIRQHAPRTHITNGVNSALARAIKLMSEDSSSRAQHLLHQADFIIAKLCGEGGFSDVNNSLKTGYDPEIGAWPDWIDRIINPELLPEPKTAGEALHTITPNLAQELGLSPNTQVHAGTTDSIAAFLACAPLEEGIAVTSLGSTLAIKQIVNRRIDEPDIGLYSHRVKDVWLVGGASNTGGAVLAHYFSSEEIERLSQQIDPTRPSPFNYYPLLKPGERFPINDPELPPRLTPRPDNEADFLFGMLEGIAVVEARCYKEIETRGGVLPRVIYSAGGGAQNPVFTAIRERNLSIPVESSEETEACVGAARLTQI